MDLVEDLNDLICWRTGSHHIWSLKRAQEERIVSMTALGVSFDFQLLVHDILSLFRSPLTVFALCEPISCTDGDQQWCKAAFFFFLINQLQRLQWQIDELENSLLRGFSNQSFSLCIEWRMFRDSCVMLVGSGQFTLDHSSPLDSGKKKNWLQLVWMLSCY